MANSCPGLAKEAIEESSFGDVSSIMIMPDQIYNNFNLLDDEEEAAHGLDEVAVGGSSKHT